MSHISIEPLIIFLARTVSDHYRIIPCHINVIPFAVDIDHIPTMVHLFTGNVYGINASLLKKPFVGKGIALANSDLIAGKCAHCTMV